MDFLKCNKFNSLRIIEGYVEKTGPINTLRGEIYYYKNLPDELKSYFPTYINSFENKLIIEHIKGIPVFSLYMQNLITTKHINKLFDFLSVLHTFKSKNRISLEHVCNNYKQKLLTRFLSKDDYPFEDALVIQNLCLEYLETYISGDISIVDFIHGDFWFSNIIIDYDGQLKAIDMRGQVNGILTLSGDPMYDYAKLYQSILGYDCILNNIELPKNNIQLKDYFEAKIKDLGISLKSLKIVTFALVLGTLPFIESFETKERIWSWIKQKFI
jgi:hypothetical protein